MPAAYSSRSVILGFGFLEELADGAPDVLLRGELAHAHRQARALELGEQLGELGLPRAEGGDAPGLDVARGVGLHRQALQRCGRGLAVPGASLAGRCVAPVNVEGCRIV